MSSQPPIRNIVFDVGRVLFQYEPEKIIDKLLPGTPHKAHHLDGLFNSPVWGQLDAGSISMEDAKAQLHRDVQGHAEKHAEMCVLLEQFTDHLDLIEGTLEIFLSLYTQGYPLYILSNFQTHGFDRLFRNYPFFKLATGMVVSGKVQLVKPDVAIYHHLLTTHTLTPQETLFIDDLAENIAACRAVGMKGIVFTSPQALAQELEQYRIAVPTLSSIAL